MKPFLLYNLLLVALLLNLPLVSHAAASNSPEEPVILFGINLGCSASPKPLGDESYSPTLPLCGPVHFLRLTHGIIDFISRVIVLPLAVLMVIWGGFFIITAGGNSGKFEQGRKIIITAIVGVAISFGASIIIKLITDLFGVPMGPIQGPPIP